MKKSIYTLMVLAGLVLLAACNDYETFGELKEKERKAINKFIADSAFQVIDEAKFHAQGNVTQGSKQFVKLDKSGVYMQIVRMGGGEPLKDGESIDVLCRFTGINIEDSTMSMSNAYYNAVYDVDKMYVSKTGSTVTATFTEGLMFQAYGSSVPAGWLVPLDYVNLNRRTDDLAKVRLIVPHSQGNSIATKYVYPYFYEITYQRGR